MTASGVNWDATTIAEYVKQPKEFVPGNKMAFAGLNGPTAAPTRRGGW